MKPFAGLGTAVLFLSLGTIVPAFAQHRQVGAKPEQKQQGHVQPPQQHSQPQQHAQSLQHGQPQQHAQSLPQRHAQTQSQQPLQRRNQNNWGQQQQQVQHRSVQLPVHHTQQQRRVQQSAWQSHRSQNWESEHRTWQQRGGYHGYRIPDTRYRGYFGPNHRFVIYRQPYMVVGGFPRFRYSGYWFTLVDPWPYYWPDNWYETDDVYIVYVNDGYYMYNRRYPTVGLAIRVSM
jgi:hypothetical protein